MSIDHGKVLTKLLELASQLERNANIDFNNPHFTQGRREAYRDSAKQIRALAQPAEAVEAWTVRRNESEDERGSEAYNVRLPDGSWWTCMAIGPEDARGEAVKAWEEKQVEARRYAAPKADAAQGAVARVAWRSDPDQGTYLVAEWLGPLPEPGELLFTHPQAAPAQGGGWRLVPALPTPEMDAAGKKALSDNGVDCVEDSDALVCYAAMLAAAPSQEGE